SSVRGNRIGAPDQDPGFEAIRDLDRIVLSSPAYITVPVGKAECEFGGVPRGRSVLATREVQRCSRDGHGSQSRDDPEVRGPDAVARSLGDRLDLSNPNNDDDDDQAENRQPSVDPTPA